MPVAHAVRSATPFAPRPVRSLTDRSSVLRSQGPRSFEQCGIVLRGSVASLRLRALSAQRCEGPTPPLGSAPLRTHPPGHFLEGLAKARGGASAIVTRLRRHDGTALDVDPRAQGPSVLGSVDPRPRRDHRPSRLRAFGPRDRHAHPPHAPRGSNARQMRADPAVRSQARSPPSRTHCKPPPPFASHPLRQS